MFGLLLGLSLDLEAPFLVWLQISGIGSNLIVDSGTACLIMSGMSSSCMETLPMQRASGT